MESLFKEILEVYGMDVENINTETFLEVLEAAGLSLQDKDGFVSVEKIQSYNEIVKDVIFEEAFDNISEVYSKYSASNMNYIEESRDRLFQNNFLNENPLGVDLTGMSLEAVLQLTEEFEVVDMFMEADGNLKIEPRPERAGKIKIYSEKEEKDRLALAELEAKEEFELEAVATLEQSEFVQQSKIDTIAQDFQIEEEQKENISEWLEEQTNRLNVLIDNFSEKIRKKAYQMS